MAKTRVQKIQPSLFDTMPAVVTGVLTPQQEWLKPFNDAWSRRFPGSSFPGGQMVAAIKALRGLGWVDGEIEKRWRYFLQHERSDAYVRPMLFAQSFDRWTNSWGADTLQAALEKTWSEE